MVKIEKVNVHDYYRSLSKKEKGKFLTYLMNTYGMNYNTTLKKFCGTNNYEFRELELQAIKESINSESWKKM